MHHAQPTSSSLRLSHTLMKPLQKPQLFWIMNLQDDSLWTRISADKFAFDPSVTQHAPLRSCIFMMSTPEWNSCKQECYNFYIWSWFRGTDNLRSGRKELKLLEFYSQALLNDGGDVSALRFVLYLSLHCFFLDLYPHKSFFECIFPGVDRVPASVTSDNPASKLGMHCFFLRCTPRCETGDFPPGQNLLGLCLAGVVPRVEWFDCTIYSTIVDPPTRVVVWLALA